MEELFVTRKIGGNGTADDNGLCIQHGNVDVTVGEH